MKIFDTTTALAAATLTAGQMVSVKEVGEYRIKASGSGITLANGNIAVPVASGTAVNVKQFGAVGDGVADDTAAIQAARDYIAGLSKPARLTFPSGTYLITSSPNWAIDDLVISFEGEVVIKHSVGATGFVFDIDGGASTTKTWNIEMQGRVQLDCVATSAGPFQARSIHHSKLKYRVLGSPTDCGQFTFNVCTEADVIASVNESAFTITPTKGIVLAERGTGEYVADSDFNVIIEGVTGTGIDIIYAAGCRFKGTSEANGRGVNDTSDCFDNIFEDMWCEANSIGDFELYGKGNTLLNCQARSNSASNDNVELVTATNTRIINGYMRVVDCSGTSSNTTFVGTRFSDNASLGIKGTGSYKTFGCVESDINDVITGQVEDQLGSENTFTPVLDGGATSPSTVTYVTQVGHWERIGNLVHVTVDIELSALTGGTGIAIITGLPFPARSGYNNSLSVGRYQNISLTGGRYDLSAEVPANQSYIRFYASGFSSATGAANTDITEFTSSSSIRISGTYLV